MFMHGSLMHLLGNMLYLWIFGDNLEDAMGHGRYLVFYLLTGILAGLAHVFVTAFFGGDPLIPSLGASGAISGVLGGYIVMYPQRRVRVLWLYQVMQVPAILAIGIWFLFQLISGAGTLGASGRRRRIRRPHRRIHRRGRAREAVRSGPSGLSGGLSRRSGRA